MSSPKSWVWHSSLATRPAGQVSVLAVVETLLAVVLYWWIAIRFETHWHLVSSVFIAPLLLLRSPESRDTGVRWFMKDWIGVAGWQDWPLGKRVSEIVVYVMITGVLTYCFAIELTQLWLTDLQIRPRFGWAIVIGAITVWVAFALASALMHAIAGVSQRVSKSQFAGVIAGVIAGIGAMVCAMWIAGGVAVAGAVLGAFVGVVAGSGWGAVTVLAFAYGAGLALRGLFFRMVATVLYLPVGVHHLPANWRENNFLTDSCVPAEMIPGIRNHFSAGSLDGLLRKICQERDSSIRIRMFLISIFFFVPAFLYRLNIKATAWFWWPLAYLLKPAPAASAEGEQRQALCWPWSNPAQRLLIVLSIGLALLSLVLHWLVATSRIESGLVTALPLAARVSLGMGWARLAPWHWAQWVIAAAGAGMLLLAGNAYSHHLTGTWTQYRHRCPQDIRWMTALRRVRVIATVALLVMSLGALLLQDRTWQAYVPVPASWLTALEDFYQLHG